jgi:hypothetical protein
VRRIINEGQNCDLKSLRIVTGKTADWELLAKDCVCFANGAGGPEVNRSQLKRALAGLVGISVVIMEGNRNGARYRLAVEK